jgi:hypothetical protein
MSGGITHALGSFDLMKKGIGEVGQAAGGMSLAFGGMAAGVTIAGVVLQRYITLINEFGQKQAKISQITAVTGVSAAQQSALSEVLARAGVPDATEDTAGGAQALHELQRPGFNELRQKLMRSAGGNPESRARMQEFLDNRLEQTLNF